MVGSSCFSKHKEKKNPQIKLPLQQPNSWGLPGFVLSWSLPCQPCWQFGGTLGMMINSYTESAGMDLGVVFKTWSAIKTTHCCSASVCRSVVLGGSSCSGLLTLCPYSFPLDGCNMIKRGGRGQPGLITLPGDHMLWAVQKSCDNTESWPFPKQPRTTPPFQAAVAMAAPNTIPQPPAVLSFPTWNLFTEGAWELGREQNLELRPEGAAGKQTGCFSAARLCFQEFSPNF